MKKILAFATAYCCFLLNSFAQPTTNPDALTARTAAQVTSIYTDNFYADLTGVNFNPNWGQSGFGSATTFTLSGNEMRHYPNMNYQGIAIGSNRNVSSLDTLHLDVWSANCSSLDIFLVTEGSGERLINRSLTLNSWNRLKIPLSAYAALGIPLTAIKEFKFVTVTPSANASIYVDNIFFYTNNVLPTLSNFSIPAKMLGDAPFTITAPTSNSSGAFSYISSNTAVATVNGNTITILKAGSSIITANQAAAAPYAAGSITATLSVTVTPLSSNAPNPTKPAANVRSIFSNTYSNLEGTNFRTSWSGAGPLVDTAIAGNDIKKYSGVDFVGIELASPTDLTLADSVHIHMWTPTAATFGLKIVNAGGGPANENLVWFDGLPGTFNRPAPLQGQWNTFSLPLSLFATLNGALRLTNRNAIIQILFVGMPPFGDNTYYIDNIYFSSTNNVLNPLPVDFKSFEIKKNANTADLNWIVANEINLASYEVEKSTNGREYTKIGSVTAAGKDSYSFTDRDLVNGINYYRIKSVDKDGAYKYSITKNISHNTRGKVEFSIYPNPAKNELVIKNLVGTNDISLVDVTGKVVLRQSNVTNGLIALNIASLPNGFYTVLINDGTETKSLRVVVGK